MKQRKSNRKYGFDYSSESKYFLTICCKYNIHYFDEIENGEMILNESGKIAMQQIEWMEKQYPYFLIHNYVMMPNHVHILGEIGGTGRDLSVQTNAVQKIKSVSELIGAFKTTSSKHIHLSGNPEFQWHRSFHDHIVRNSEEYDKIFNYISENPLKWNGDIYNS